MHSAAHDNSTRIVTGQQGYDNDWRQGLDETPIPVRVQRIAREAKHVGSLKRSILEDHNSFGVGPKGDYFDLFNARGQGVRVSFDGTFVTFLQEPGY